MEEVARAGGVGAVLYEDVADLGTGPAKPRLLLFELLFGVEHEGDMGEGVRGGNHILPGGKLLKVVGGIGSSPYLGLHGLGSARQDQEVGNSGVGIRRRVDGCSHLERRECA